MSNGGAEPVGRIGRIVDLLAREYGEVTSFLHFRNPFELLIAVILSARTTDRQVNLVTPDLFERWPTPKELAASDAADVEELLHPIGFFRAKTRSIRATARELVERFGGRVPESMEELTGLPGVGRKSANVIRGTIFGKPAVVVDTHFGRVVRRLGLTEETDPTKVEIEIGRLVAAPDQMRFSMLANKHGRVYCHARKPQCASCPVRGLCPYAQFAPAASK